MSNNENIQNVLQILKELDKTNSFEVYLPSLQKTAPFKQLNTEQLKQILKASIDSPIYKTQFTLTINNIIKENILDETININDLNIFDKLFFLLKTRIESISPTYTFYFTEDEISENSLPQQSFTINLSEIYNNFVASKPIYAKNCYKNNNYEVVAALPNILTEDRLEKELHENVKLQVTSTDELRNTIGETFINEITKYISELKINEQTIDLNKFSFKDRIKIVEQLPATSINQILKYIEDYKALTSPLLYHTEHNIEKEILLNSTLFNI